MVRREYDVRIDGKEVLLGNVAFLRCFVPEHVKDYVSVTSWQRGDEQLLAELADMGMCSNTNLQFTIARSLNLGPITFSRTRNSLYSVVVSSFVHSLESALFSVVSSGGLFSPGWPHSEYAPK